MNRDTRSAARATIAHHSKSFALASRLLPDAIANDAVLLYAYCRRTDDAIDLAPPREHAALMQSARCDAPFTVTVDVEARTLGAPGSATIRFVLDERKRRLLMSGMDEIAATLAHADAIGAFRERHRRERPWIYASRAEGDSA
jgi:hypothetical protein